MITQFQFLSTWLTAHIKSERGASLVEYALLVALIAVIFLERQVKNSRVGRMWEATREDEDAAEIMGVPVFRFKLWAFAMGAAIGGMSGALWAGQANFINSTTFSLENSILVLAAVLLGGAGNIGGAILGGFLVIYIPDWLRSICDTFGLSENVTVGGNTYDISATSLRYAFFGAALIIVMIFRPQGLWPSQASERTPARHPQAADKEGAWQA